MIRVTVAHWVNTTHASEHLPGSMTVISQIPFHRFPPFVHPFRGDSVNCRLAADRILLLRRQSTVGSGISSALVSGLRFFFDLPFLIIIKKCAIHTRVFHFRFPAKSMKIQGSIPFRKDLFLGQIFVYSASFFSLFSAATAFSIAVLGGTPLGHTRLQLPYNSQAHNPSGISARFSVELSSVSLGSM